MRLLIDIGNTSTTFGLAARGRIIRRWTIPTGRLVEAGSVRKSLPQADEIYICSVVPRASAAVKKMLRRPAHFVTAKNIPFIKIKTRNPAEVGADRLVNALAAARLYGVPSIVVDFGTATTIDVVNRQGEYLGGIIAPGLELGREALAAKTALLPWLKLTPGLIKRSSIGRGTQEAMSLGLVAGQAAMVDEFVVRIGRQLKARPKIIATGGCAGLIVPHSREMKTIDVNLTLKGLALIASQPPTTPQNRCR